MDYDAIIVGGSFSGLSAATQLARARRKVLVIDAGKPRNRFAAASHGFLGQDGVPPRDIVATARNQLLAYPNASIVDALATAARKVGTGFEVEANQPSPLRGKRLILATGVNDNLPAIEGLRENWGRTVFHCPYCHGYELRQGPIAVLAVGRDFMHQALMLPDWGPTTFLINRIFEPDQGELDALKARNVTLDQRVVSRVDGSADSMIDVVFADGQRQTFAGIFVASKVTMASPLAEELGCAFDEGPMGSVIRTDAMKATTVEGVFACGDAARMAGNVAFAVSDGVMAGIAAHRTLMFGQHPAH